MASKGEMGGEGGGGYEAVTIINNSRSERDGGSRRRREGERPARPDGPDTTLIITPNCSYHLRIGFNYDSHENSNRP